MRDHMRYIDELQCAAARVVSAVRRRAKTRDPANVNGDFDTFHIRRGDFQYKNTRIDASKIYDNVKGLLQENATVFIATDERDKGFFDPLREHFDLLFLDDFVQTELENVNPNVR
jgi:GDP-fucose protein O-fucosyltransferase